MCDSASLFERCSLDKIAIFIDGGYLYRILEDDFGGLKIDYKKLSSLIAANHSLLRTYYYDCPPYESPKPTNEEIQRKSAKQRFFSALEKIERYEVRLGRLRFTGEKYEQKGVDVHLAIDLVQLASKHLITYAALIAADNDFVPAVKVAKNEGVVVQLYHGKSFDRRQHLWQVCDDRIQMTNSWINQAVYQTTFDKPLN